MLDQKRKREHGQSAVNLEWKENTEKKTRTRTGTETTFRHWQQTRPAAEFG
jgi:hypothetical protein